MKVLRIACGCLSRTPLKFCRLLKNVVISQFESYLYHYIILLSQIPAVSSSETSNSQNWNNGTATLQVSTATELNPSLYEELKLGKVRRDLLYSCTINSQFQ